MKSFSYAYCGLEEQSGHANDKDGYENDWSYYHIHIERVILYKNIIQNIICKVLSEAYCYKTCQWNVLRLGLVKYWQDYKLGHFSIFIKG